MGIGCATSAGGSVDFDNDLRGTVAPADSEPHLVVVGPAVLLHLDSDHRRGVTLFRVVRREGTAADCVAGSQGKGDVIELAHRSVYVTEKESVCATLTNGASLTWHAREGAHPLRPLLVEHQASLR